MQIKQYEFRKAYKKGLPNYSSIDASFGLTIEVEEGETVDTKAVWQSINQEILENLSIEEAWQEGEEAREKRVKYNTFKAQTGA